ncbi:DUF1127 domain-containing protein [Leisingera sp. NJS204]|uniref:DUF1127 domain-containing protein n=1 Tax=Leisingera sp. NJS204 TaxID=2508307 RepID=UPI00101024F6|nr:DUF1127 domain-containing protein [Leisingera sp. NJS204]QAX28414.1 DUF1127 domain-containing protein [Leisingera sp. NJS204]
MTAISTNVGAGRRWLSSVVEDINGWIANAKERRRIRHEKRALSHLPNHLLRDIGLEQYAVPPDPIIRHRFV